MKCLGVFFTFFLAQLVYSQTDLIIVAGGCYNFDNQSVLEELKVFKSDVLFKEFDLTKQRPFYPIKSLSPGSYSIHSKKNGAEVQVSNFKLDSAKQHFVSICIDSVSSINSPIIDQLADGEVFSIEIIRTGCFTSRAAIYIQKESGKYYARFNDGKKKKLSKKDIQLIRSFETEFYRLKNCTAPFSTMRTIYVIKYKNYLYSRDNFIDINLNYLKLKSN